MAQYSPLAATASSSLPSAFATQAMAPSMALEQISLDILCPPVLHIVKFAFGLAVDAQLLTLAIDDLHDLLRSLFGVRADVERRAKKLLRVLVEKACHVLRAARVEGMSENDIHPRSDEVTANGNGLLAHPLGSDAYCRHLREVIAQSAFEHDLGGRLQQARIVHTASHVQDGRDADRLADLSEPRSSGRQRRLRRQHAGLRGGDGGAAGLEHETIPLDEFPRQGIDIGVGLRPRVTAADNAHNALDPALDDGVVQRAEGGAESPAEHVFDRSDAEARYQRLRGLGNSDFARVAVLEIGNGAAEERLGTVHRVGF